MCTVCMLFVLQYNLTVVWERVSDEGRWWAGCKQTEYFGQSFFYAVERERLQKRAQVRVCWEKKK
jgi:hypothetical protein